jgi:hypothetical protein
VSQHAKGEMCAPITGEAISDQSSYNNNKHLVHVYPPIKISPLATLSGHTAYLQLTCTWRSQP